MIIVQNMGFFSISVVLCNFKYTRVVMEHVHEGGHGTLGMRQIEGCERRYVQVWAYGSGSHKACPSSVSPNTVCTVCSQGSKDGGLYEVKWAD